MIFETGVCTVCFDYEWNFGFHRQKKWNFEVKRDASGIGFRFGPFFIRRWR